VTSAPARSRYIVSAPYDWLFFLLPPGLALVAGGLISGSWFSALPFQLLGSEFTAGGLAIGTLIHAHLVAVVVRSHGNPQVRRRHPARFLLVPPILWLAITSSGWAAVAASVLATFWDVWHSAAQTFGFVRAYDRNRGNPPHIGRQLDFWLNQWLYAGPIIAGATMLDHFGHLEGFKDVGPAFFASVPAFMVETHWMWTRAVVVLGFFYLVFYVIAYWRLHRRGYQISFLKVYLLASTGFCSLFAWGFNSFGEAFFMMNLFHSVQYLALVWAKEGQRLTSLLRLRAFRHGGTLTLGVFLFAVLAYGFAAQLVGDSGMLWAVTVAVSLLHFWYDGFIWSVQRREL
jgi:hypothetical protein